MLGKAFKVQFICVGGNKCGTTWLYEMLRQHPEINASINKEPHFFSENVDRGWDWYRRNWKDDTGKKGEFSTTYLYDAGALERIASTQPDVRILVVLRHPFERAKSHLRHLLRTEEADDPGEFLENHPAVVENSLYTRHLQQVERHFAPDQVKLLFFDQLKEDPRGLLQSAFEFLEVGAAFVPARMNEVIGGGFDPKNQTIDRFRMAVYTYLKGHGLYRAIRLIKRTGITKVYKRILGGKEESAESDSDPLGDALKPYHSLIAEDARRLREMALVKDKKHVAKWMESLSKRGA